VLVFIILLKKTTTKSAVSFNNMCRLREKRLIAIISALLCFCIFHQILNFHNKIVINSTKPDNYNIVESGIHYLDTKYVSFVFLFSIKKTNLNLILNYIGK
jgi:hypothetical protein